MQVTSQPHLKNNSLQDHLRLLQSQKGPLGTQQGHRVDPLPPVLRDELRGLWHPAMGQSHLVTKEVENVVHPSIILIREVRYTTGRLPVRLLSSRERLKGAPGKPV